MIPTILVVEAQPALRRQYARFLRDEGYEVVTVAVPDEVLTLARRLSPDVVVLDPDCDDGKGMKVALTLFEAGLPTSVVFNTSHPYSLEADFSTWVADAYTVRTHGVGALGRAVRQVLHTQAAG